MRGQLRGSVLGGNALLAQGGDEVLRLLSDGFDSLLRHRRERQAGKDEQSADQHPVTPEPILSSTVAAVVDEPA